VGASGGTSGEGSLIIAVWKPADYVIIARIRSKLKLDISRASRFLEIRIKSPKGAHVAKLKLISIDVHVFSSTVVSILNTEHSSKLNKLGTGKLSESEIQIIVSLRRIQIMY